MLKLSSIFFLGALMTQAAIGASAVNHDNTFTVMRVQKNTTLPVSLHANATVNDLKQKIFKLYNINVENQRILGDTGELEDNVSIDPFLGNTGELEDNVSIDPFLGKGMIKLVEQSLARNADASISISFFGALNQTQYFPIDATVNDVYQYLQTGALEGKLFALAVNNMILRNEKEQLKTYRGQQFQILTYQPQN